MATDEREWKSVPEARAEDRAEAAEQRVRELEDGAQLLFWDAYERREERFTWEGSSEETRERYRRRASVESTKLKAKLAAAIEALRFYGDPDTYVAVAMIADPPCGEFIEDFSEIDGVERPGKRARATLAEIEGDGNP